MPFLVITANKGCPVKIGNDITIIARNRSVSLAIDAPAGVDIIRNNAKDQTPGDRFPGLQAIAAGAAPPAGTFVENETNRAGMPPADIKRVRELMGTPPRKQKLSEPPREIRKHAIKAAQQIIDGVFSARFPDISDCRVDIEKTVNDAIDGAIHDLWVQIDKL